MTEVVLPAYRLCDNEYGDDEAWLGMGSGTVDASLGQANLHGLQDTFRDDAPDDSASGHWDAWEGF